MEFSFLTAVFLPLALFIIMLGMGLGLTIDDFKRVLIEKGLVAQLILLPIETKKRCVTVDTNIISNLMKMVCHLHGILPYSIDSQT